MSEGGAKQAFTLFDVFCVAFSDIIPLGVEFFHFGVSGIG